MYNYIYLYVNRAFISDFTLGHSKVRNTAVRKIRGFTNGIESGLDLEKKSGVSGPPSSESGVGNGTRSGRKKGVMVVQS
jgi:hypothetical protein